MKAKPETETPVVDVTCRHFTPGLGLQPLVSAGVGAIASRLRIKRAFAVFERRNRQVHAAIQLETPGPDLVAHAAAPTPAAAWHALLARLRTLAKRRSDRTREARSRRLTVRGGPPAPALG